MYENIASLIVFIIATANCLTFFLRWKKFSSLYNKTSFTIESTRTYFIWNPYGKPRKIFHNLIFLAGIAFAPPLFLTWVFVIIWSIVSAFPILIIITGLYIITRISDYELLDFAKDFTKYKPSKIGVGDLNLLKQTWKVLRRSVFLSFVLALVFLSLTIALTFLIV
ncbi:MAG: hypothetical protein QHH18_04020 [Candidatus Bathyarchaeota archaeon]|nr:hypothetical protein [Candidatus Bathyarchaeota archaeon A05DMB-5]MDH7557757.1 hypothetical protein [Candidatus Bathyarchaeota archaeon]